MRKNMFSVRALSNRLILPAAFLCLLAETGGANALVLNVCSKATPKCQYTNVQQAINAAHDGDTINIGTGIFAGPLILDTAYSLTISGNGPDRTVIKQYDPLPDFINQGIVTCNGAAAITISDLTITGNKNYLDYSWFGRGIRNDNCTLDVKNVKIQNTGSTLEEGGGIGNTGTMTLTNSTVQNNEAPGGGGIFNSGTLTIKNSDIQNNTATAAGEFWYGGGGILNRGILTLVDVNVQNNSAVLFGGGIANGNGGTLLLKRSNVHHNNSEDQIRTSTGYSPRGGGGIYNSGTLQLQNSFIDNNQSTLGGGIFEAVGSVIQTAGQQTLFLDNSPNVCANINGAVMCE